MLQQPEPLDYVVATGKTHSVREFAEAAFDYVGLDWKEHVRVDPRFIRPAEVDFLRGDASKAEVKLRWRPRVHFGELVKMMVKSDLALLSDQKIATPILIQRD